MDPIEQFVIALVAAIAGAFAQAIVPAVIQQIQLPSTAQDGFSDAALQTRINDAINSPRSSAD